MSKLLHWLGNAFALLGILLCAASGLTRITGNYFVLGYEAMTVFVGGLGLMLAACLAKLELLRTTD